MNAFLDKQDAEYMKDPDTFERMSELYDSDSGSEVCSALFFIVIF